jgi:hypothetical protein
MDLVGQTESVINRLQFEDSAWKEHLLLLTHSCYRKKLASIT